MEKLRVLIQRKSLKNLLQTKIIKVGFGLSREKMEDLTQLNFSVLSPIKLGKTQEEDTSKDKAINQKDIPMKRRVVQIDPFKSKSNLLSMHLK